MSKKLDPLSGERMGQIAIKAVGVMIDRKLRLDNMKPEDFAEMADGLGIEYTEAVQFVERLVEIHLSKVFKKAYDNRAIKKAAKKRG